MNDLHALANRWELEALKKWYEHYDKKTNVWDDPEEAGAWEHLMYCTNQLREAVSDVPTLREIRELQEDIRVMERLREAAVPTIPPEEDGRCEHGVRWEHRCRKCGEGAQRNMRDGGEPE